jgi:6-phospho-3-hexuloisomerase
MENTSMGEPIESHQTVPELMNILTSCMEEVISNIDIMQTETLLKEILRAERIFVSGAGRAGYIAKAFAMRLTHLQLKAFVVGETVTPAFSKNDLLVVFSGSGKTLSIVEGCQKAKEIGGRLCVITASENSPMTRLCDTIVLLDTSIEQSAEPDFEIRQLTGKHRSMAAPIAPLATLFETAALILSDATIAALMEIKHGNVSDVELRFPNLQ